MSLNKRFYRNIYFLYLVFGVSFFVFGQNKKPLNSKQRIIILTDISYFEPDDTQSLIRLLLYSNQLDIEGLITTTQVLRRTQQSPEIIQKVIQEYAKVRPNLLKHEKGYPKAQRLLSVIKKGLPKYGMEGVGKDKDSEGSEWILKMLEKNDERPLWISIWGGSTILAQTLWKIKETKTDSESARLIKKLRVYAISDQDDTGMWIRKNYPDLFYIVSPGPYEEGTWSGINKVVKNANNDVVSNFWIAENIQQGHGALGAAYPSVVFGAEGDTPAFLHLINNGLNAPEHPNWGGWGGRYELYTPEFKLQKKAQVPMQPETRPIWTNVSDTFNPYIEAKFGKSLVKDSLTFSDNYVTLWRWREEFQNDFAARLDWCTKEYKNANHPPVVALSTPEAFTVKSGERFIMNGNQSFDPDGDALMYHWFCYGEAGTYQKEAMVFPDNDMEVMSLAPEVDSPKTIHFILKVTDRGKPRLTRYKRVIVTIVPKSFVSP